jgi:hypothetical protein
MADDFTSTRGSWFGQFKGDNTWRDPGDKAQNKSGLPQSTPGAQGHPPDLCRASRAGGRPEA